MTCKHHGNLCAFPVPDPTRCPQCHARWDYIRMRGPEAHSCEVDAARSAQLKERWAQRRNVDGTPGDAPDARQGPRRVEVAPGPTDSAKGPQIAGNDNDVTQGDA